MRRLATIVLAGVMGCVGDPKRDPCREPGARCDEDAGAPDAASGRDAAARADAEAGSEPPLDATTNMQIDASRELDAALRDVNSYESPDGQPRVLPLEGDLDVHDPSIIEADGAFVIFSTGPGLRVKRSRDLLTWSDDGSVFSKNPAWIASAVPGATDLWAPDISSFNGQYHLYYSASTFGSRVSCIGHATASDLTALDFDDHGPIICTDNRDDYNAIDPALVLDDEGTPWLAFGSFWSGIKLIRLDSDGQRDGSDLVALASRQTVQAIEAPFIVRRGSYYYLFVSFDLCCRGAASTYRVMVGRSETLAGPYFDADGKSMLSGGGSMVVVGDSRWHGAGHNAVLTSGDSQFLVYHAYDAYNGGAPTLRITDLLWDDMGWPVPAGP